MTELRALLWDVDGTLAETERDGHRVAFNLAFEALQIPWRWDETHYGDLLSVTGGRERLLADMARRSDAPGSAAERDALARELHALKNRHYAALVHEGRLPLRPGVAELIDEAESEGLLQAITTTTSRSNADALLSVTLGPRWQQRSSCAGCPGTPARCCTPRLWPGRPAAATRTAAWWRRTAAPAAAAPGWKAAAAPGAACALPPSHPAGT